MNLVVYCAAECSGLVNVSLCRRSVVKQQIRNYVCCYCDADQHNVVLLWNLWKQLSLMTRSVNRLFPKSNFPKESTSLSKVSHEGKLHSPKNEQTDVWSLYVIDASPGNSLNDKRG